MSESSLSEKLLGIGITITIVLIILRVTNVARVSWAWIFSATILPLSIMVCFFVCNMFLFGLIVSFSIANYQKHQFPKQPKEEDDDDDDDDDDEYQAPIQPVDDSV